MTVKERQVQLGLTINNLVARRVALARIRGMAKGRLSKLLKENRKIRKEWNKRVDKLGL